MLESKNNPYRGRLAFQPLSVISKIQLVVYYQCCVLIGDVTRIMCTELGS